MGDLDHDTQLTPLDPDGEVARFAVELSDDWRIWTLNGGYVAAVALRAVGAVTEQLRPATLSLQLLSGAVAGAAEVRVRSLRRARAAECLAVSVDQGGRRIVDGHAWTMADRPDAPTHDDAGPCPAGPPGSYPTVEERVAAREARGEAPPAGSRPDFPFWDNLDARPTTWLDDWDRRPAGAAVTADWLRFRPTATFSDPFLDAGRVAVALDLYSFPSMARAYAAPIDWIAPNIDLHCVFHRDGSTSPWILGQGRTPVAAGGAAGFTAQAWSQDGLLLASGGGQMLPRTVGPS